VEKLKLEKCTNVFGGVIIVIPIVCLFFFGNMDGLLELLQADDNAKLSASQFSAACGRPINLKYPFGNPVSIERTHLPIFASASYMVADKSDGVRVCIILSSMGNFKFAVAMERTGKMYGLAMKTDAVFFQGTIMDAELVRTHDGNWRVLLFDACAIAGNTNVEYLSLPERLELLESCMPNMSLLSPNWTMEVKKMFPLKGPRDALPKYLEALAYNTDGFILTPEQEPASQSGTAPHIFKIKTCHTMDFLWSGNMLWYGDQKELFPITNIPLPFDGTQLKHVRNGAVVEMSPQVDKAGVITMIHFAQERPDKDTPNSYFTVHRTLQSVIDAITLDVVLHESVRS